MAKSETPIDPPLEAEFKDYGRRAFESWEELRDFAANETEIWQGMLGDKRIQNEVVPPCWTVWRLG